MAIGWRAVDRLSSGAADPRLELGIGVSVVAMVATFALLAYQRYVIRKTGSVAILTDHVHYQTDLLLNLSVIAALVLDQLLGWRLADPLFGLAIAAWLLYGAWSAASHAVDQLMDREWPEDEREAFLAAAAGISRARRASTTFAPAPRARTASSSSTSGCRAIGRSTEAHQRMDAVEEKLQHRFPGTEIIIHLDPEGHIDREGILPKHLTESAR